MPISVCLPAPDVGFLPFFHGLFSFFVGESMPASVAGFEREGLAHAAVWAECVFRFAAVAVRMAISRIAHGFAPYLICQSVLYGVHSQLNAVFEVQALHDDGELLFHGAEAQVKLGAYLFVRFAVCYEAQDVPFPLT